ncbi:MULTISPECIES: hypothetical protein [Tenacibaculum]|uniref:hypothetical protein n=1 Tax=Tenacibaculum TaxID=104267 RepID=UPI001F0A482F|nr:MULTISPECIES: hypothetical protein [Tenacibaculum]MCH3882149.1 hypothetical protein [Tenacibaculum aquimarinum]MDO6599789.1 hypothetical protein [Tenacibaculum sp. 1_MG-2023]
MTYSRKPTALFWVIGIIALLWNGLGVIAYLTKAFITEEMIATLPKEQQAEFLVEQPAWVTAAFAIAVFGGLLASILLLMKKKLAYTLFLVSAFAAIAQHAYLFTNVEITSIIMPAMVIVVCVFLVWYSKKCIRDRVIS